MHVTSSLLAGAIALALVLHLVYLAQRSRRQAAAALVADAANVAQVMAGVVDISSGTAGVSAWAGSWNGERAQVSTIVDTLATRKLPTRWISVSITEKVDVPGIFDMMMRPGSATTFSNFDLLAYTLPTPAGLPAEVVVRSDRAEASFPIASLTRHTDIFDDPRAKELLITPKGVRIVWLLGEADRVRYGVFRQADFGGSDRVDPALVEKLLSSASRLRAAINEAEKQAAA